LSASQGVPFAAFAPVSMQVICPAQSSIRPMWHLSGGAQAFPAVHATQVPSWHTFGAPPSPHWLPLGKFDGMHVSIPVAQETAPFVHSDFVAHGAPFEHERHSPAGLQTLFGPHAAPTGSRVPPRSQGPASALDGPASLGRVGGGEGTEPSWAISGPGGMSSIPRSALQPAAAVSTAATAASLGRIKSAPSR
jgi:hypothetical protein